jgi:hypothetical protein
MYDTGQRPPRPERNREGIPKVWFIAIGLVVLGVAGLLILNNRKPDLPIATKTAADSISRRPAVATNPRPGIGVGRSAIERALRAEPYLFAFEESGVVAGESNYLGRSRKLPRAVIQLLGRPDDLSEVAYTDLIQDMTAPAPLVAGKSPVTTAPNVLHLPKGTAPTSEMVWMAAMASTAMTFTRAVDSNATEWMDDMLIRINQKKGAFGTKEIDGRFWTVSFSRLGSEGHFLVRSTIPKPRGNTPAADTARGGR